MTKDYATVLAQVIPIFALAIGFQARLILPTKIEQNDRGIFQAGALAGLIVIQAGLFIAELSALESLEGAYDYEHKTYLYIAIGVAFLSPLMPDFFRIISAIRGDSRD